jgi:hypothetical protein
MQNWFIKRTVPSDRNLSYEEKLKNFPSVNYTSLRESVDRRKFMQEQFDRFGITNTSIYITERYTEIADYVKCTGSGSDNQWVTLQYGTIISHLNLMKNWYVSTNEEYAIFCEDDVSFESIEHWNFTWDEFVERLPNDWECIQLTKVVAPCTSAGDSELKIKLKWGRWWGSYSLIKRDYVKRLLDKTCIGYNEYHLDTIWGDMEYEPIIENLLYLGVGTVYNFPMLVEHKEIPTTFLHKLETSNESQELSHKFILEEWRTRGRTLSIDEVMTIG